MNKCQEIKTSLSEILTESTAYGLPKIIKSKRILLKLFWLAFFLLGCIPTIYFTIESINNYLQYEKITQFETISLYEIQFPTVVFCSSSFDDKSLDEIKFESCFTGECISNMPMNKYKNFQKISYQCFQFNRGRDINGNSIPVLNATVPDSMSGFFIKFKNIADINVNIDDQSSIPFINGQRLKAADVVIKANTFKHFILSKKEVNKLGLPYNTCYKDPLNEFPLNKTIINYIQSFNATYKQENCYKLCADLEQISVNNKKEQVEKCQQYCPLECDSILYSFTIPNTGNTGSDETYLSLYYEKLQYTKLSEIPKTQPFDLVSNIGGILGLFIGCSFVTFFELTEVIMETCYILFNNKKQIHVRQIISLEDEIKSLKQELNYLKIRLKNRSLI
jgi:hypothetical protein